MLFLALRNIRRHSAHALLLGILFALSSFLFISGNSLLLHSNRVLRSLFTTTITGDLVIASKNDESISIFGSNIPAIGELVPIPLLKQKDALIEEIQKLPAVEKVTPLVSGIALMDVNDWRRTVPVFGIEPATYFSLLEGVKITAGRILKQNERGVMLSETQLERIAQETGRSVALGDEVLFTTGGGMSFRIRGVPLVGVFAYPVSIDYVDQIALLDAVTLRVLNSIQYRITGAVPETGADTTPSNAADLDLLFGTVPPDGEIVEPTEGESMSLTVDDVLSRVHSVSGDQPAAFEGSVHFFLVRGKATDELNLLADRYGAEVLSWREAAGQAALLALLLQVLFNGGFVLFVLAAGLGSMNIVFISTYRRTREIGTLRAIGTEDRVVRGIFIAEHLVIGILGWLTGSGAAYVLSAVLSGIEIVVSNPLIAMLLGGQGITFPIDTVSGLICLAVVFCIVAASVGLPLSRIMRLPIVESIRRAG